MDRRRRWPHVVRIGWIGLWLAGPLSSQTHAQPLVADFLYQLAQEQLNAGQDLAAIQELQKLLLLEPGHRQAREQLTQLQARQALRERIIGATLDRLVQANAQPPATPAPVSPLPQAAQPDDQAVDPGSGTLLRLLQEGALPAWIHTSFNLSSGYRIDNFDWNIAGDINGQNPNVLSELIWEDVEMAELAGEATLEMPHLSLRTSVKKGYIRDGENQDSDFLGNDRTLEFSRSTDTVDGRSALDLSVGAGIPLRFWDGTFTIVPLGGYSYHELKLNDIDGILVIPNTGPFADLNSTYESFWTGPWTGVDVIYAGLPRLKLAVSAQMHWANYHARADWNLRSDFQHPKSFTQHAEATGFLTSGSLEYAFSKHWAFRTTVDYALWSTHPGHDQTFLSDGTRSDTRLNEVNWKSLALLLGLTARF